MAHERHTPYKAQLERYLSGGATAPFSARTLADVFENGSRDEISTLRAIQAVLQQAYADGRLVRYRGARGDLLTEDVDTHIAASSRRLREPAIYGLPGGQRPDGDAVAVPYSHNGVRDDNGEGDDDELDDEGGRGETLTDGGDPGDAVHVEQDTAAAALTVAEAENLLRVYPPDGATAPGWVDDRVLRAWISLPGVSRSFVAGLDRASGPEKLELIRAGVPRKLRGGLRGESTVAGNLALLCRTSASVWINTAASAIQHHVMGDGAVPPEELLALAADPLKYYDDSDHPPDMVLLFAMALGADEAALEMIAVDCATLLGETKLLDKATAQQERIDTLEAEAVELRRAAKQADRDLREEKKAAKALNAEIERLRVVQAQVGSASEAQHTKTEQELLARAEAAEAQVDRLETERVPELEAQLEGLQDARERLEEAQALARDEQRLRAQAEQDAARHNARARALTDELSRSASLPTDDAGRLFDALGRPIGQAARHAAERLAAGRAQVNDGPLLELAAAVAKISGRVQDEGADEADAVDPGDVPDVTEEPIGAAAPSDVDAVPAAGPDGNGAVATSDSPAPAAEPVPEPAAVVAVEPSAPGLSGRRRRRSGFKVRPLGGGGEVGGSAILVSNASGHTVLLDCGQRVRGEYGLDTEPQFHRRIGQDGRLHAILISHAHIDHVGSLPILHREQSNAQDEPIPVYMTAPTRALSEIMLGDSAKIQQKRSELDGADLGFLDYGAGSMEAAYRQHEVARVLDDEFFREVTPALAVRIPDTDFIARFLPVAHVLGSCAIHLTDDQTGQTLLYTGDLGPFADPQATLPQFAFGELLAADLVIMESTYGAPPRDTGDGKRSRRALSGRESALKQLCEKAAYAHERGGCVLLPAFSLGRTQELAKLIGQAQADGEAPTGDIIVGGMGEKITQVYAQYSKGQNAWARAENMPRVNELGGRMRARRIDFEDVVGEVLDGEFCYIVASPALLTSGWSRAFLDTMVDNPRHAIVMSGHIPRHAGNIPRLHTLARGDVIDLGYRKPRIEAAFKALKGLSAHAPSVDLRRFAQYMTREGTHVAFGMVHGDEAAQVALAQDVDDIPNASAEALYNGSVWQPSRP
ncbi:MAG: MBL fold metallo-hydrolase [Solirubrobacteraceae bacterium]